MLAVKICIFFDYIIDYCFDLKDACCAYDDDLPLPFDDLEVEVEGGTKLSFKGATVQQKQLRTIAATANQQQQQ
jgi:hypothetical protein